MRWLVDNTGLLLGLALAGVVVMVAAAAFMPHHDPSDQPRRPHPRARHEE